MYRFDVSLLCIDMVSGTWPLVKRQMDAGHAFTSSSGHGYRLGVLFRPSGHVDHRLARRHVVNEVKRGRLDRSDVCDAHPDLLRAAKHLGEVSDVVCPICEDTTVRYVTYAFGPRLPAHGKLVENAKELARLDRGTTQLQGYTVEACPACGWHHLQHSFAIGRPAQTSAR